MKLNVSGFVGTVILKDWMVCPDGQQRQGFTGTIRILEGKEIVGFEPGHREANWIARVESEDGTRSMNILGCQIRGIIQDNNARSFTASNYWKV